MSWKELVRSPLELTLTLLLTAIVAVTFSQVVFRYLLQAPLAWSEELARFLLMWLASLSAAYAFKKRAHFALRFWVESLAPGNRRRVEGAAVAVTASFLAVFSYQSLLFAYEVRDMVAAGTGMSMAIPYSSAFVGGALMLYHVVTVWLRGGEPAPDEPASRPAAPGGD